MSATSQRPLPAEDERKEAMIRILSVFVMVTLTDSPNFDCPQTDTCVNFVVWIGSARTGGLVAIRDMDGACWESADKTARRGDYRRGKWKRVVDWPRAAYEVFTRENVKNIPTCRTGPTNIS